MCWVLFPFDGVVDDDGKGMIFKQGFIQSHRSYIVCCVELSTAQIHKFDTFFVGCKA